MGGYSVSSGFMIWSRASADDVLSAAREALKLLESGRSDLAVSSYCGTNLVTSALIGGLAAVAISRGRRGFWPGVKGAAAALIASSTLGRPLGRFLQRRFTTLSDVEGMTIDSVRVIVTRPTVVVWVGTSNS